MTNWDIGNQEILEEGAAAYFSSNDEWRSMDSAPRDGSWVELKCTYGVAPWYCLARWTTSSFAHSSQELVPIELDEPSWVKQGGGGPSDENSLYWRPYEGNVDEYTDPPDGHQNSPAYWRGAVAAKYGLPLEYFEAHTARNVRARLGGDVEDENRAKKRPWWRFWADWDFG